jgi:hypothetical protein
MHSVTLVSGPQIVGAMAYLDSNNNLVYVPAIGVRTIDTLVYSLCDELGTCATAHVIVTINGLVNTGIQEADEMSLTIYPNPAHSVITLHSTSLIESLTIVDLSGREMMTASVGKYAAGVDISSLSAGVYTVLTRTSEGLIARRLIKE